MYAVVAFIASASVGWMTTEVVDFGSTWATSVTSNAAKAPSTPTESASRTETIRTNAAGVSPSASPGPLSPGVELRVDGRPFPPRDTRSAPVRMRGCIANDAFGEGCYFRDAMVCVGFGDHLRVGLVVEEGDPLMKAENLKLVHREAHGFETGGMDFRYFQHGPVTPLHYSSGLYGVDSAELGTSRTKLWPDMVCSLWAFTVLMLVVYPYPYAHH